jgi:hypothetical protein
MAIVVIHGKEGQCGANCHSLLISTKDIRNIKGEETPQTLMNKQLRNSLS